MRDKELLADLLAAETELEVLKALNKQSLLESAALSRWKFVGDTPNNQAVILAQQSSAAAALVEKYTNAVDAILLRRCKASGVDPRSSQAPQSMSDGVASFVGDLDSKPQAEIVALAEEQIVLYATGTKARPSLSLYDAGEGQLAEDFSRTFCSLISAGKSGSYKREVPFVQGRFNMGGTGVLQFCSDERKLQLIVSRVPRDVIGTDDHEWAFTLFCFFPKDAAWRYLVGTDGNVMTAGRQALGLLPRRSKRGVPKPRVRKVQGGTLIKMYDFEAPRSNVCGELFRKIEQYLVRPSLPIRIIECRESYKAKVMAVTVWDCMRRWKDRKKLEAGFEDGASIELQLDNGEKVPGEIRVFVSNPFKSRSVSEDGPHIGIRTLINGQSHGRRDGRFFRSKAVDKEHLADSILVTLFCEGLSQASRNQLFLSDRERLREGSLLDDLLAKLRVELRNHEALADLNQARYEEKVKGAVRDEDGLKALEELLATDPTLASMFGTTKAGSAGARTARGGEGGKKKGKRERFVGADFPSFFHRGREKDTVAEISVPQGGYSTASFVTDVKNNYFTRRRPPRGAIAFMGALQPSYRLFDGRLTLTFRADKKAAIGTQSTTVATVSDKSGSGPFVLTVQATVVKAEDKPARKRKKSESKAKAGPSAPDIKEKPMGPDEPPLKIQKNETGQLLIILNTTSSQLEQARAMRPPGEAEAVKFVFKYGLALTVMGLLDAVKATEEWKTDDAGCRERIEETAVGFARVIVPLCLTLPKKLPKRRSRAA